MKITVCIPMYNESAIAADCVKTLFAACGEFMRSSGDGYEIIFCDDGSKDGCADIVRREAESLGALAGDTDGSGADNGADSEGALGGAGAESTVTVRVVGYEHNRGKGCAVRTAFAASTGDIVMYTDCDLAYGTDVIGEAVAQMKETDADVLIGSRNVSSDGYAGYTFVRKLASKAYIAVLNLFAGFKLSDSQCGFKLFRGDAGRRILSLCETDGFAFDQEALMIAAKMGLSIAEFPVKIVNHRASKVRGVGDAFKMLADLRRIKKRVKKLEI